MLESTNQAATQEALTQEGSMILLSDKWGIQLEDICEASENSKEEKKTVERETDEERHEILEICYVNSTFIYSIKLSTHTNYSDYNMAIN